MLRDFMVKPKEKLKVFLSQNILLKNYPDFANISQSTTGEIDTTIRSTKSTLQQGGLEISIKLRVGKGKVSLEIFRKMKSFVLDIYREPEQILFHVKKEEEEEDEFFITFQTFRLISTRK